MDLTCDEYMPSEEDLESWDRVSDDVFEGECDVTDPDDAPVVDDVTVGDDVTEECEHCGKQMLATDGGDVCLHCMQPPYLESDSPYSEFFDSDVCDDYIVFNTLNTDCEPDVGYDTVDEK